MPPTGAPKRPPIAAEIAAISSSLRVSVEGENGLAMPSEMLAIIWIPEPSRPVDAPNRCEIAVAKKTIGAIRLGTPAPGSCISSNTKLLPWAVRSPKR